MRIRALKPEFWRSDAVTALPREVRLLLLGLWSYVDDNGVGVDDYRQIAADLFALEEDQVEVRQYVREGLATLSRGLLLDRYEVDGRSFLFISKWDYEQRVDRPNKPRYPRPPADPPRPTRQNDFSSRHPREGVATVSRNHRETPSTGTGEQGNRGTGEQGRATPARARSKAAENFVAEWIKKCPQQPPRSVIEQTTKTITTLLDEGIDPDGIRAGIKLWWAKGLPPTTLPGFVHEAMNRPRQIATTDQRILAGQAIKARFANKNKPNNNQLPWGTAS